jgi:hypothetical protein
MKRFHPMGKASNALQWANADQVVAPSSLHYSMARPTLGVSNPCQAPCEAQVLFAVGGGGEGVMCQRQGFAAYEALAKFTLSKRMLVGHQILLIRVPNECSHPA